MKNSVLIKNIKRDRTISSYVKSGLIKIIDSNLYSDTCTIISTLDKSPRSLACTHRFNQIDPTLVRTKRQLDEFRTELTSIHTECLKCTINPYLFISTGSNRNVQTIGDIMIPNSSTPLTLNQMVVNPKYDYLDKARMVKDYLFTWNRDAKKYLEEKIEEDREYLAKSHYSKYSSFILKFGCFLSIIAFILIIGRIFMDPTTGENANNAFKYAFFGVAGTIGTALMIITNAVVNSFHSRTLRKYDRELKKLDYIFDRHADHTYDVEAATMKRVHAKRICNLSLNKINVFSSLVKKLDIDRYVYSERQIANRRYGFLKALAFLGFVATMVSLVIIFSL